MSQINLDDEQQLNKNGSLKKTLHRVRKPLSFCLLCPVQSKIVDQLKLISYGPYIKNILYSLSDEEFLTISKSDRKSLPVLPMKVIKDHLKTGIISVSQITNAIISSNKLHSVFSALEKHISDEIILEIANKRGLLDGFSDQTNKESKDQFGLDTNFNRTNSINNPQYLDIVKVIREYNNLSPDVILSDDYINDFVSEHSHLLKGDTYHF